MEKHGHLQECYHIPKHYKDCIDCKCLPFVCDERGFEALATDVAVINAVADVVVVVDPFLEVSDELALLPQHDSLSLDKLE